MVIFGEKQACGEGGGTVSLGISHPALLWLLKRWMMLGGELGGGTVGTQGDVGACALLTLPNPTAGGAFWEANPQDGCLEAISVPRGEREPSSTAPAPAARRGPGEAAVPPRQRARPAVFN